MKLQVGTEFNIIDKLGEKYYRKVIFHNNLFKVVNEESRQMFHKSFHTLKDLNDYYYNSKTWEVDIIKETEQISEVETNVNEIYISTDEIGRVIAYELMKKGKSLNADTLEIIENAVFDLLIEKRVMVEEGDVE